MISMATAMNREYHKGASPPGRFSASKFPLPLSQLSAGTAGRRYTTGSEWFATISAWTPPAPEWVSSKIEGKDKASTAKINSPVLVTAADLLKCCSLCLQPPTRKAEPKTSSRLESTEPSMESWTTRKSPACIAQMQTMTSVMLPKVAFSKPPRVWLVYLATSSVTKEMRSAKGTRATREERKIQAWLHSPSLATKATGMASSRTLSTAG
mmetsp:Transcript_108346/g.258537  ORF Transcript_108346/g.258537 Transcript_108346/m.258537 type:complete len:210 (+) Transcript_108346:1321-1950(+)